MVVVSERLLNKVSVLGQTDLKSFQLIGANTAKCSVGVPVFNVTSQSSHLFPVTEGSCVAPLLSVLLLSNHFYLHWWETGRLYTRRLISLKCATVFTCPPNALNEVTSIIRIAVSSTKLN